MNNKKLLKDLKDSFSKENAPLDFRSDVYLENQYGLSPCMSYDRARDITQFVYDWADDYIAQNKDIYPEFSGWRWNLDMATEELRTSSVYEFVNRIIDDLINRRSI